MTLSVFQLPSPPRQYFLTHSPHLLSPSQPTTHTARSHLGTHSSHYGTMDSIKGTSTSTKSSQRKSANTTPQKHIDLSGVLLKGDSSDDSDQNLVVN